MAERQRKFDYSVSEVEVAWFVDSNECVHEFLNQYEEYGPTYHEKAMGLARFFRWMRVVKRLSLSPSEFLNTHMRKRSALHIKDRKWALNLALRYSRNNPDLSGRAIHYKYCAFFLPVKAFCDYHEVPLTTATGFFKKRGVRKYPQKPFTVEFIKRVMAVLGPRDQAICMTQLQSGQSIEQVLVDINKECKYIFKEIDAGKLRIRLDFNERKGNGFPYFSFISQDAIQAIQNWRPIRQWILEQRGIGDCEYLFISKLGNPFPPKHFHTSLRLRLKAHGLYSGPLSVRSSGFRKFFEQEASPPERGISKAYVSFMMGHSSGKGGRGMHQLHSAALHVHPRVVEREYEKLEKWLNIYTSPLAYTSQPGSLDMQAIQKIIDLLDSPEKIEKFRQLLDRL